MSYYARNRNRFQRHRPSFWSEIQNRAEKDYEYEPHQESWIEWLLFGDLGQQEQEMSDMDYWIAEMKSWVFSYVDKLVDPHAYARESYIQPIIAAQLGEGQQYAQQLVSEPVEKMVENDPNEINLIHPKS